MSKACPYLVLVPLFQNLATTATNSKLPGFSLPGGPSPRSSARSLSLFSISLSVTPPLTSVSEIGPKCQFPSPHFIYCPHHCFLQPLCLLSRQIMFLDRASQHQPYPRLGGMENSVLWALSCVEGSWSDSQKYITRYQQHTLPSCEHQRCPPAGVWTNLPSMIENRRCGEWRPLWEASALHI